MRRLSAVILTLALVAGGPAGANNGCAPADHPGGDWRVYGHDLQGSRTQPKETTIGVEEAAGLVADRIFPVADAGGQGWFQSTPVIADGCLYAATDGGNVYALNADTFAVVWSAAFEVSQTRLGGVIAGAVTVEDGRAFVSVSDAGHPFVIAFDQFTGQELWRTVIDDRPGSFSNASPMPFAGMLFVGFSGDEYVPAARGGYVILDQRTGGIEEKRYTIPDVDFDAGYWGGSIWSSGVYDPEGRSILVGSGNPGSHDKEHQWTNSLLKIDAALDSATFGDIVDAYKGNVDQYYPGLDRQPACRLAPDVEYADAWSATCAQLDLDFGASPNLLRDARGNLLVGALQKSGVYHAAYADTMQQAWTSLIGSPCWFCNAASSAAAGGRVIAAGTQPGQVIAVEEDFGGYQWASPLADVFHYQSVTIANGVAYVPDYYGNLNAFDTATGMLLLKRNVYLDVGAFSNGISSAGVAVARNTIYVPSTGYLLAYRMEG